MKCRAHLSACRTLMQRSLVARSATAFCPDALDRRQISIAGQRRPGRGLSIAQRSKASCIAAHLGALKLSGSVKLRKCQASGGACKKFTTAAETACAMRGF